MKKTMHRILCMGLALMLALLPTLVLASDGYFFIKTSNGKTVNLRAEPVSGSQILSRIPYRAYVLVYEYSGGWAYIEAENPKGSGTVKGWVDSSFLVRGDPGPYKPIGDDGPTFAEINSAAKALKILDEPFTTVIKTKKAANYVHLRWFPSTSAAYSGAYLRDTEIRVLALSKTWAQVQVLEDGYVGFILRSCVTE